MSEQDEEEVKSYAAADTREDAVAVELTPDSAAAPADVEKRAPSPRIGVLRDLAAHALFAILSGTALLGVLVALGLHALGLAQEIPHLYASLVIAVLVVSGAIWGLSLRWLRHRVQPLRLLTDAARAQDSGELVARVPMPFQDEVSELSRIFDGMRDSMTQRDSLMRRMQEAFVRIGRQLDSDELHEHLVSMFIAVAETASGRLYISKNGEGLHVRSEIGGETLQPVESDAMARAAFEERWDQMIREDGSLTGRPNEATEMAIPLLSGTHRNGVIRLGRRRDGSTYDEGVLAVLHTLTQFASVTIENAGLHGQLAAQQRIEQEMLWARNIQEAMWPSSLPDIPGYELYGKSVPANEVGGDYFDFVAGDQAWHVLIGDVSGKGVPAALIMSLVRSLMRTYLEFDSSPSRVLSSVNRNLSRDLEADMFVTLSALRLEPERNVVRFARAGHEPTLLVKASGEVEPIAPKGAAVGLVDPTRFQNTMEEIEVPLAPGDTLFLYTDGVTEARNKHDEEFGTERIIDLVRKNVHLPAQDLYDALMQALESFANGAPRADDITVVILRRNGA